MAGSRFLNMKVEVDTDTLVDALEQFGEKAIDHFVQGVMLLAESTMTLSKASYVPVVTGTLRASGFVTKLLPYPDGYMVDIGYGGAAAHYAAAVHFAPHSHGQHKNLYLSRPMQLMARSGDQMMGNWMQRLYNQPLPAAMPQAPRTHPFAPPASTARKPRAPRLKRPQP